MNKIIGVIAAMPEEIALLKQQLSQLKKHNIAGIDFYQGQLAKQSVMLALSGIGKVNAAITTTLLANHFMCNLIINTGSAAGVDSDLTIGDVVIANEVAHHDVDLTFFDYQRGQLPQLPAIFHADNKLVKLLTENVDQTGFTHTMKSGLIVSGDQFVTDATSITQHFKQAFAIEMEAAAVAQTCHRFDIPFVIIRSISDNGDQQATISFQEFLPIAADNAAKLVICLLQNLD